MTKREKLQRKEALDTVYLGFALLLTAAFSPIILITFDLHVLWVIVTVLLYLTGALISTLGIIHLTIVQFHINNKVDL